MILETLTTTLVSITSWGAEPPPDFQADTTDATLIELPDLRAASAPEFRMELLFEGGDELVLTDVRAGRILSDGTVLLGDHGNKDLLLLDRSGRLAQRIGREGEGPGEFLAVTRIAETSAGFDVYDNEAGRWTRFAPAGDVIDTHRMPPPNFYTRLLPLSVGPDREGIAIYGEIAMFHADGETARNPMPVLAYRDLQSRPDSLLVVGGSEYYFRSVTINGNQASSRLEVGFAPRTHGASRGTAAVVGDAEEFEIRLYEGRSLAAVLTGGGPRLEVHPLEIRTAREAGKARLSGPSAASRAEFWDDLPFRPLHPAFEGLSLDEEGRVWIGVTSRPSESSRRWVRVTPDGSIDGSIRLPRDAQILDARSDALLLHSADEWDVPVVRLVALNPMS